MALCDTVFGAHSRAPESKDKPPYRISISDDSDLKGGGAIEDTAKGPNKSSKPLLLSGVGSSRLPADSRSRNLSSKGFLPVQGKAAVLSERQARPPLVLLL
jgi:hypothetical protein